MNEYIVNLLQRSKNIKISDDLVDKSSIIFYKPNDDFTLNSCYKILVDCEEVRNHILTPNQLFFAASEITLDVEVVDLTVDQIRVYSP